MKLEKGGLIWIEPTCWYVIVNIHLREKNRVTLDCICDNANNIYGWDAEEVSYVMTPRQCSDTNWDQWPDNIPDRYKERGIPWNVIVEVLSGKHDERFED